VHSASDAAHNAENKAEQNEGQGLGFSKDGNAVGLTSICDRGQFSI